MSYKDLFLNRETRRLSFLFVSGMSILLLCGCETMNAPQPSPRRSIVRAAPSPTPTPAVPTTQVYVYPRSGQAPEQLDRDRYECHTWAVKQSNFDPSESQVAPHQRIQVVNMPPQGNDVAAGAATGAVLGAVVSHPREVGAGAIIGAIAGAAIGAASEASKQQQIEAIQRSRDADDEQAAASLEQQASGYRRAIGACLEGRGYTVK